MTIANRRCWLLTAGAVAGLSVLGCSIQPQAVTSKHARDLPLEFKNNELKVKLESTGLFAAFSTYWRYHAERRWAERYRMERFGGTVTETFYSAYHDAAWIIERFIVTSVHEPDALGRVRVDVDAVFRHLTESDKENRMLVQDWWVNADNGWMHLNTDPMLNGLKPVV